ncbi:polynucleotide kinase-phosphatase [Rhodococcus sp. 06-412-2C]|uniref:polynucleotide kinase-phosphatase n=1 Tax=unclassified Rhodococcus (in: high G+C Gram-positive bacteria) TaxID=192944 RepID=UPI000B9B95C1|nr:MULTISPECIES: polynucleotide kinase-phosphatase [unclassified Rhodococcus (in: high G+C Gram-positive bacteria)]OZC90986.1 polynucleotide kinase-phosphatase [Rhodococcus sp. 06-412-2C]OZC97759.1 polynucleotide kinase-phosphatase [Rhodococcus sp. 06-412-2B]
MSTFDIPDLSLVVLIGISGSGKSSFAAHHFGPYETVSSDACRGMVSNDPNLQSATKDAFALLEFLVATRLRAGLLTVVDATNVQPAARKALIALAREHDVLPVAVVLDVPEAVCAQRNAERTDRTFGRDVLRRQQSQLQRSMRGLGKEGFRSVHVLDGIDAVASATFVRTPLRSDRRELTGPFDVIGDIHGCLAELETLLAALGYTVERDEAGRAVGATPPDGRTAVFLGDYIDRGPDSVGVLRLVMGMVGAGAALAVPGNHENKLVKALRGRKVTASHGLAETLEQLDAESAEFRREVLEFCDGLVAHLVLDVGRLVVAHAGLIEKYHNRASGRVRSFALYGDTTGETDEFGLPVRYPWAKDYRGSAKVLYGHTPVPEVEWENNTACLDTGCVFGGKLTALRYPEREIVSVPAEQVWYEPARPVGAFVRDAASLDLSDVIGPTGVETSLRGRVSIRPENAAGALEVMSRFALAPQWLHYLPPTMAPSRTSERDGYLEYPTEPFDAYRALGASAVICEEKHMGSRVVVVVCRDVETAREKFDAPEGVLGTAYTRTGRPVFDEALTGELISGVADALERAGVWDEVDSRWLILDCELMPWSAKAEGLIKTEYAAVGAESRATLDAEAGVLAQAASRGLDVQELRDRNRIRQDNLMEFTAAYRRYIWPTDGLSGVRIAPFQVLASDRGTYADRPHQWHLDLADRMVTVAPEVFAATRRIEVDLSSADSVAAGEKWWEELTAQGGEGMVVKPAENCPRGKMQPGMKVRGREYLRLIYGADYTDPDRLTALRNRNVGHKQSMALREYALGMEALDRSVRNEPLYRVHQAVFAVLALESEPVDPRL